MRPERHPSGALRRLAAVLALLSSTALVPAGSALGASSAASIQKEMDRVAAQYGKLETQLAQTEAKQAQLTKEQKEAEATIAAKSAALKARAGYMYKTGGVSAMLGQLLTAPSFGDFVKRVHYMGVLGSNDTQLMEELRLAQTKSSDVAAQLGATEARQRSLARNLRSQRETLEDRLAEARRLEAQRRRAAEAELRSRRAAQLSAPRRAQLQATASGAPKVSSAGRFSKFTLPVSPAGFADTWGAARSGGRRHQGTDVMAPCGAPVLAVTDGSVQRLASSGAGGTSLYLRAANGDVFFYAHLSGYAGGVRAGTPVSAGQVIASNGNSGNARGGPCHVHFEWHPSGGRPVNPYSLLNSAR
ncbi:MAG TPA: peptidoglycan DD-metalloendopeptidase family protein [Actinomycetota bacterium]|nr:peptidoglycan DD-metalloendopeptidase family protein [Actinomycetota bacterium]